MDWYSFWETYKTFVGWISIIFFASVFLGLIALVLYGFFTAPRCPKCGSSRFMMMVGGPPKCKGCGWQQENFYFTGVEPNSTNRYVTIMVYLKNRLLGKVKRERGR